jgi:hypothetical protein
MAKGQMKGNKEAKKPKADKPKSGGSAYKLSRETFCATAKVATALSTIR